MKKYLTLEHFEKYLTTLNTKSFTEFCERCFKNITAYFFESLKIISSIAIMWKSMKISNKFGYVFNLF